MYKILLYICLSVATLSWQTFAAEQKFAPIEVISDELIQEIAVYLAGLDLNNFALSNSTYPNRVLSNKKLARITSAIERGDSSLDTQFEIVSFLTADDGLYKNSLVTNTGITFGQALRNAQNYISQAVSQAVLAADREALARLVARGANPNWPGSMNDDQRPLFQVVRMGRVDALELLLELPKTDVNITDIFGRTALFFTDNPQVVSMLLEHGIDVAIKTTTSVAGDNALHNAAYMGHEDIVRVLLNHPETKLDEVDKRGRSALHVAAGNGQARIIKILIDAGSDVNLAADGEEKGEGGNTPLHSAAMSSYSRHNEGTVASIRVLLDAQGIDAYQKNLSGQSAFMVIFNLFRRHNCLQLESAVQVMASDDRYNFVQRLSSN